MKWDRLRSNWDASFRANVILSGLSVLLIFTVLALSSALSSSRARVILIPPNLTSTAQIGYDGATDNYYKGWALYIAEMIGNVTPDNADFVVHALGPIFAGSIYPSARIQIIDFAHDEDTQGLSSYYHADSVVWQPSTQTAFVSGTLSQTTADLMKTTSQPLTFQMNLAIVGGQPQVRTLTSYSDPPHTLEWLSSNMPAPGAAGASSAGGANQ